MVELGYALSSEELSPRSLVQFAQRAEEVGFSFALDETAADVNRSAFSNQHSAFCN